MKPILSGMETAFRFTPALKEGSNKEERKEGGKEGKNREKERKKDIERRERITYLKRSVLCFDSPYSEFWDI